MYRSIFSARNLKVIRFIFVFTILAIGIVFAFQETKVKSQIFDTDATNKVASSKEPVPLTTPMPEPTHNLVASFYDLENYPNARLLLNNKGLNPIELRPTLYSLDGEAFEAAPVTVEPNSYRFVSVGDLAGAGGANFQKGSIKLFHTGKDLIIGSQIYLEKEAESLSFEERFSELGKFDSRRLEAVWLMPRSQTQATVILSNTSDAAISVNAKLSRKGETQTFPLAPHQTRVLDVRTDFTDGQQIGNAEVVGISLEHTGERSALKAHGQIKDAPIGYSNIITFTNPNNGKSRELHGFGLHLGAMDGENLEPVVALRNVGAVSATVTVKVPYTRIDDTTGTVELNPVLLKSGGIRLLDMTPVIERSQNEQIKIAGIEISYDTAPGSVLAAVQSVSENRRQVFRVPLYDPFAQVSSTGGYPWRIDETSRTVFYVKNTTDVENQYVAYLVWDGGQYMIGLRKIAPHKTVEIDMKYLRDMQIPDERGNTIPLDVNSGQIKWSIRSEEFNPRAETPKRFELIGRSEQIDTVKGISSSYACQNCCQKFPSASVFSGASEAEVGDQVQFTAYEQGSDCYGNPYFFEMFPDDVNWSSSNNNIATVNNWGVATIVGVGSVSIRGQWYETRTNNYGGFCPEYPYRIEPGGDGKKEDVVQRPDCSGACTTTLTNLNDSDSVTASPRIELTVPENANDGDDVTFSVTHSGGTPTGYQWTFTAPSNSGNSPQVNFSTPQGAQTTAKAHWFANPNEACGASRGSTYKIKVQVTFSNGSVKTKEKNFRVNVPWERGGITNANVGLQGGPTTGFSPAAQRWVVVDIGTMRRVKTVTKTVDVPAASQFFNKVDGHEDVHVAQWGDNGLFGVHYDATAFFNRIRNFSDTTRDALLAQIGAELIRFLDAEDALVRGKCNQGEIAAYNSSDSAAPQYMYQRCGRTEFPNCQ